ncbi:PEP/pyruvate-binding domain-containing protein [Chitinophagaceae bacterium 26-R-25]|nr:PEP/pyruvate-binding domain-containing protein [Chitinophagaceae bacterium 26-R-25]
MVTTAFTRKFSDIKAADVIAVGEKNAILGEIYSQLSPQGLRIPNGFAVTSFAFEHFLTANALHQPLNELMNELDQENYSNLKSISAKARALILRAITPYFIVVSVRNAYEELCNNKEKSVAVVVRSSAYAANLPLVSFADLHESFLSIDNEDSLLEAIKKCFASLYSDRAIKYRVDNHLAHARLSFSIGVQKMVHSQNSYAGTMTESACGEMLEIKASTYSKESPGQSADSSDNYVISRSALLQHKNPFIKKRIRKDHRMHVTEGNNQIQPGYILTDTEIITLANWAFMIDAHFGKQMDIEWMKDGKTGELYIVRAMPATLPAREKQHSMQRYNAPVKSLITATRKAVVS